MTGTVIGLVSVFSGMQGDARANIGPAMAMALTATFYGLALANGMIMPLADRLQVWHLHRVRLNERIVKVLVLINQREPIKDLQADNV